MIHTDETLPIQLFQIRSDYTWSTGVEQGSHFHDLKCVFNFLLSIKVQMFLNWHKLIIHDLDKMDQN